MKLHLDTHVALWLVAGQKSKLRAVASSLREASLFVSPVAIVEMEVLREIGRIRQPVASIRDVLQSDYGVEEAEGNLRDVAHHARSLGWTRDPFDRFLVAHAVTCRATLLTADTTILQHCPHARWE